ncbi:hypothetical protein AXF42_Ash006186 [Apostasia shenzhenica]|uniref:Uncharacterized protein n=1 Tax=Apostasia shenzhenica TaxID=1088818 RepID=A0A2I0B0J4_9ASPA|nr:hypothetical protein AXF42_Ash006186 [Apostasia shenzhenica]
MASVEVEATPTVEVSTLTASPEAPLAPEVAEGESASAFKGDTAGAAEEVVQIPAAASEEPNAEETPASGEIKVEQSSTVVKDEEEAKEEVKAAADEAPEEAIEIPPEESPAAGAALEIPAVLEKDPVSEESVEEEAAAPPAVLAEIGGVVDG